MTEKGKISARKYFIKKKYGLTLEQFDIMREGQGQKCAICGSSFEEGNCNIDHNHRTNKVRGLLCSNCNHGLGAFEEDQKLLKRAICYLERY